MKAAGVDHVIVHARKCLLNGLSTSANRTVPPLRYDVVHRLALEFPELEIVLNGGINNLAAANDHIRGTGGEWGGYGGGVAGVMVGRAAYFDPWTFRHTDSAVFGSTDPGAFLFFLSSACLWTSAESTEPAPPWYLICLQLQRDVFSSRCAFCLLQST